MKQSRTPIGWFFRPDRASLCTARLHIFHYRNLKSNTNRCSCTMRECILWRSSQVTLILCHLRRERLNILTRCYPCYRWACLLEIPFLSDDPTEMQQHGDGKYSLGHWSHIKRKEGTSSTISGRRSIIGPSQQPIFLATTMPHIVPNSIHDIELRPKLTDGGGPESLGADAKSEMRLKTE